MEFDEARKTLAEIFADPESNIGVRTDAQLLDAEAAIRSGKAEEGLAGLAALGAKLGDGAIATYNDAPGRTKEEVLALVDKAIALAEEKIKGSIALAKEDE